MLQSISFYLESYSLGGHQKTVTDYIEKILKQSTSVTVYSNKSNVGFLNILQDKHTDKKIIIVPLKYFTAQMLRNYVASLTKNLLLRKILNKLARFINFFLLFYLFFYLFPKIKKCQIFHAINGGYPGGDTVRLAVIVAKCKGCQNIFMSVLSTALKRHKIFFFFEVLADKAIGMCVNRFHVNSEAAKVALTNNRGFKSKNIEVIYTGIKVDENNKATVNFNKDELIIGNISMLMPYKGHKTIIDAAEIINGKNIGKRIKYLFIGDGPEKEELKLYAKKKNVDNLIDFSGFYAQPNNFLISMDIFVFPSRLESFPYAVLEAMEAGLPIIASRVAGIPEQIVDNESGLLIEPNNPQVLADSIIRLIENPEFAKLLAKNAYLRVKEKFDIMNDANNIMNLYANARM